MKTRKRGEEREGRQWNEGERESGKGGGERESKGVERNTDEMKRFSHGVREPCVCRSRRTLRAEPDHSVLRFSHRPYDLMCESSIAAQNPRPT